MGRLKNYLAFCQQNVWSLWDFCGQNAKLFLYDPYVQFTALYAVFRYFIIRRRPLSSRTPQVRSEARSFERRSFMKQGQTKTMIRDQRDDIASKKIASLCSQ